MGICELKITISKKKKRFGEKSRIQKNFVFQIEVKKYDKNSDPKKKFQFQFKK